MSVYECVGCGLTLTQAWRLRFCRACANRMHAGQPRITRPQVAEATAHYLAAGCVITCLPDGPVPKAPDVRLSEESANRLEPIPWPDLIAAPPHSSEFRDREGGQIPCNQTAEVNRTALPADVFSDPIVHACKGLVLAAASKTCRRSTLPSVTEGFTGETSVEG